MKLKIILGVCFVCLFFVNLSIKMNSNSDISLLANIGAISVAGSEDYEDCCNPVWENVSCKCNGTTYSYMEDKD